MNKNQTQLNSLIAFRNQFTVSIRRDQRAAIVKKCRLHNIRASEAKFQQQHSHINNSEFDLAQTEQLLQYIVQGRDDEKVVFGLVGVRKLLAEDGCGDLIERIIQTDVYDVILKIAKDGRSLKRQMEANWILANLATGDHSQVNIMVQKGIFQHILQQLTKNVDVIDQQLIYLVGNIAGTDDNYMVTFIENGTLKLLVRVYEKTGNAIIRKNALWAITNISRVSKPIYDDAIELVIPLFVGEMRRMYGEVDSKLTLNDIAWTIWKITAKSKLACLLILKLDAITTLVQLTTVQPSLILSCIRILGSLSMKLDSQNDLLIQHGVLMFLEPHLSSPEMMVRKETCWVLSNYSAGTQLQSTQLFQNRGIMQKLEDLFFNDSVDVRINAGWVISNFIAKIEIEFIYSLFERAIGGFIRLCEDDRNITAIDIGLKGIQNYLLLSNNLEVRNSSAFLKNFQEINKIVYRLQSHPSKIVTGKINDLVINFFEEVSEQDDDMFI